jgi:hypothetical protein
MPVQLNDAQIAALIAEPKHLPGDFHIRIRSRPRRGHKERDLDIKGGRGSDFTLIVRESLINALDFSVILGYAIPSSGTLFRLRRYNGKSHEHTNKIEGDKFYDFHIHEATERYQNKGLKEETFAIVTNRYNDFRGARNCMLEDCGFVFAPGTQIQLI